MKTGRGEKGRTGKTGRALKAVFILIFLIQSLLPVCLGQDIQGVPSSIKNPQDIEKWLSGFTYQMKIPDAPQSVKETLNAKAGDCDDLAKVVSEALAELGMPSNIVVIKTRGVAVKHAICIWKDESGNYNFFSNKRLIRTEEKSVADAINRYFRHCESFLILGPEALKAPMKEEYVTWGFKRSF